MQVWCLQFAHKIFLTKTWVRIWSPQRRANSCPSQQDSNSWSNESCWKADSKLALSAWNHHQQQVIASTLWCYLPEVWSKLHHVSSPKPRLSWKSFLMSSSGWGVEFSSNFSWFHSLLEETYCWMCNWPGGWNSIS